MSLVASVLGGLGRARKVPRAGLWQLTSKRGPRNFYKGKGCLPTGQHTRKGGYVLDKQKLPEIVVPDLKDFKARHSDSEASSSDEEESEVSDHLDKDFLAAFAKIKQRDASIYDPDSKLFDEEGSADEGEDGDAGDGDSGETRPVRKKALRQVLAEQALEGGADSDSDAERRRPKTYNQEQRDVKSAFLEAAGEVDEQLVDGDFGQVLKRPAKPADAEEAEQNDPVIKELLVKCFGAGERGAESEDAFLRDYVQRQQWKDEDEPTGAQLLALPEEEAVADLDGDREHIEQADRFEASFNFRFEEPGAEHAVTHPRVIEGTVRKKDERRKQARERKAQRKAEEEKRQQEEAKRARKAARAERKAQQAEMEEATAGLAAPDEARVKALMDSEDWDPDTYDAAMAAAFGEDYYEVGEADEFAGGEDAEEVADEDAEEAEEAADEDAEEPADMEEGGGAQPVDTRDQPGNASLLDEDDNEDVDVPAVPGSSRFRYRQVAKQDFGLDILDILGLDSKELNQVVGLKRLAPYREDRGYSNTQKLQELRAAQPHHKKRQKRKEHEPWPSQRVGRPGAGAANGHAANSKPRAAAAPAPAQPGAAQQEAKPKQTQKKAQQVVAEPAVAAAKPAAVAQPEVDDAKKAEREKARRLASYGKLTLRAEGPSKKGTKRKAEADVAAEATADGSGLTKGEKKRLKRSMKRAQKHTVAV